MCGLTHDTLWEGTEYSIMVSCHEIVNENDCTADRLFHIVVLTWCKGTNVPFSFIAPTLMSNQNILKF